MLDYSSVRACKSEGFPVFRFLERRLQRPALVGDPTGAKVSAHTGDDLRSRRPKGRLFGIFFTKPLSVSGQPSPNAGTPFLSCKGCAFLHLCCDLAGGRLRLGAQSENQVQCGAIHSVFPEGRSRL